MSTAQEELKKIVEEAFIRVKEEMQPEEKGIELKREWDRLDRSSDNGYLKINISKILREIAAIANSYRPGNGYLIIGIDEVTGSIIDSPFKKSGLKDRTDFYGIMVKNVEKPVDYEFQEIKTDIDGQEKTVSVFIIPPSLGKPHVLKNYLTKSREWPQYIPVKKDTGIDQASRNDLELMYYDKANIGQEYGLSIFARSGPPSELGNIGRGILINLPLIFENFGRKPLAIISCKLMIVLENEEDIVFNMIKYHSTNRSNSEEVSLFSSPLILSSNTVLTFLCSFQYDNNSDDVRRKLKGSFKYYFSAKDAHRNIFYSELFKKE